MDDGDKPDEPEVYLLDFSNTPGAAEYRERLARVRAQSRRRYRSYLATVLDASGVPDDPEELAALAIDTLTTWTQLGTDDECHCSCHPRLPDGDFHDFGFGCPCSKTAEDRRRSWEKFSAERDAFWASEEGQRIAARREAEEAELQAAIAADPAITVSSAGGMAPEQWRGEVDGHSFYFRERHDHWRIDLDLRPTGHFVKALVTNDDGEVVTEDRETDEGDMIASGDTSVENYGATPAQRLAFIAGTIRTYLARQGCQVHTTERADLELLFGRPLTFCPACGSQLES